MILPSQDGRLSAVSKASRLTLEFGHFQDFVRINKSLLPTKDEEGAGENASRRDGAIVAWHEVPGTGAPPKRAVP
jgi:hypothetical protein